MKIVIATPLYPPEPGGPATYSKLLESELPARGIEVVLVKFGDVRKLPKFLRHIAYVGKVYLAARGASLVYALDPVSTGLPAYLGSALAGVPFAVKIVGDYAWEQGVNRYGVQDLLNEFVVCSDYPFPVMLWKKVERFVARRAQRIIVPSRYLKCIVAAWDVDPEKITVVYNAPPVFAEGGGRPLPGRYIVTVGRLVPWKGIDGVIRALTHLPHDLSFVVIGDGPERSRLEALAQELGLSERVIFTGALSHGDAPRYVRHAEAFVLNTCYEGFSHVILEAFSMGTPVATTDAGGNPEQVTDGETGVVFPFNDAEEIAAAVERLEDPTLRARVIGNAQRKVAEFSRERMIQETVAALT